MFKILKPILLIWILLSPNAHSESNPTCTGWSSWVKPICQRLHQIWTQGDNELYLSGYAWHNRYTYTRERIDEYNEAAWGGGLGKSFYDEKGNWHGLYAIAFLDSHTNIEPMIGYSYLKMAHFTEFLKAGIGLTAVITQRPDIFNGIPFPGVVPLASITYRRLSISGTYVPGAKGAGNVLFLVGKWRF
jgi:palmitoyl transferase